MTISAVFPGQGAQSVGMLSELAQSYAEVKLTFEQASEILGYDLWALSQEGPAEKQSQTEFTQPLMLVASIACYRLYLSQGGQAPSMAAGHSLGEYAALYAAGAVSFEDVVATVKLRAELMRDAAPNNIGGMAAIIGLDDQAVVQVCADNKGDDVLEAVNFNAPGQVVVSGHVTALERSLGVFKEAGAKRALMLSVSVPNHSALMMPAVEPLYQRLEEVVGDAKFPVVQNFSAKASTSKNDLLANLKQHVAAPVKWVDCVSELKALGVTQMIEFGPGKVLTGLAKRIDKSLSAACVASPDSLAAVLTPAE